MERNFKSLVSATLLGISALLLFTACDKKKHEPDALSVSPTTLSFIPDGGVQNLAIETNVDTWTFSVSSDWLAVQRLDEKTLTVNASKNTDYQNSRSATLTVMAGDAPPVSVSINQQPKVRDNLTSPASITFLSNEEGDKIITIGGTAPDWTPSCNAAWLTVSKANASTLVVSITQNKTIVARSAVITISGGDAESLSISVTQAAAELYLTVGKTSLSFAASGSSAQSVTVETNADSWSYSSSASWAKVTKSTSSISVSVDNNTSYSSRSATVTVTAGSKTESIAITQSASAYTIPTTYTRAASEYRGNTQGFGTALTLTVFYQANTNIGFHVQSYSTLPECYPKFSFTTGTYNIASTGAARTYVAGGYTEDGDYGGTIIFNFDENKVFLVTGGTFDLTVSGTTYTIKTNFSAKDATTGETRSGIVLNFTGTIPTTCSYGCEACKVDNPYPPTGYYSSAGTVVVTSSSLPSPTSWSTYITNYSNSYWHLNNFGGTSGNLYLRYKSGQIIVDNYTAVATASPLVAYWSVCVYNSSTEILTVYPNIEYPVNYNATTKVINYAGTINGSTALFGVVAFNQSTGAIAGLLSTLYSGFRQTLTSASSAPLDNSYDIAKALESFDLTKNQLKNMKIKVDRSTNLRINVSEMNPVPNQAPENKSLYQRYELK